MSIRIKFKLNKNLDKKMALVFLDTSKGGIEFSNGIIQVHPQLKIIKKIKNKKVITNTVNNYFDNFYKKHHIYLLKQTNNFEKRWQDVEKNFFKEVRRIFKNYKFPKGKYEGYVSIINCNPRFLQNKTFQVFYAHQLGPNYVTAHELMHFIFYDYALKKYSKIFKKNSTETGLFWDLAEIFNSILLHMPAFIKIHGIKKWFYYPEHKKYIFILNKVWKKHKNVDEFILEAYKLLSEKQSFLKDKDCSRQKDGLK